ncbi:hypothetical protein AS034_16070 [[Bacillus] enclensis]|uniref:Glucokinase n=1 Tax=[Bacillus] enclensis TaxID=1402860 RepID=A0A0V8HCV5_9BACI|nr:ROK family protein [[Bacillus] enclensis]KSU60358.1 hypothetical protein AS034_16070 [[Bacillus] enclensis]SCC23598.1 glucokinase [[Bacillus] enclensis]
MRGVVVFDIGGTYTRSGLFTETGRILNVEKDSSPNFNSNESIYDLQEQLLEYVKRKVLEIDKATSISIEEVGIAFPGPITKDGCVLKAPTLWGEAGVKFPMKDKLESLLDGISVTVINDLTAAGYRYMKSSLKSFGLITISSGVGNKVFWNEETLLNDNGAGGELGHYVYKDSEFPNLICDCGSYSHIGAIASGRGMEQLANQMRVKYSHLLSDSPLRNLNKITTFELVEGIRHKDPFSEAVLRKGITPIANAILFMHNLMGLEDFIIIGGFALAIREEYKKELCHQLSQSIYFGLENKNIKDMIHMGVEDDLNGLIGMGIYVFKHMKKDNRHMEVQTG